MIRLLLCCSFLTVAGLAQAADLSRQVAPPAPPPVVAFVRPAKVCFLGQPLVFYRAPDGPTEGLLPSGLEVEVIDYPYSVTQDLWVRVKAPRPGVYYGWVYTRDMFCH